MGEELDTSDLIDTVVVQIEVDEEGVVGLHKKVTEENENSNESKQIEKEKKILKCEQCDFTTKHYVLLQRHGIAQHRKDDQTIYKCSQCDYESVYKANLKAHMRKHSTEKKFKCAQCNFETAYRHCYVKHTKTHMSKEECTYRCDKCPFETKFEGHITRHLARIHKELTKRARRCEHCDFSTKVGWRLNAHLNKNKQDKPFVCDRCDFVTSYLCGFKFHKGSHRRMPRDFVQVFTKNPGFTPNPTEASIIKQEPPLNSYVVDSTSELEWKNIPVNEVPGNLRLYQCTECQYMSKFKAAIQRHHFRLHTDNNRPYKCTNCDFSTKTKDKINLHTKRSQSKTVLVCTSCPFSTFFKCQLQTHHKQHNQFKCQYCAFTCKLPSDVQRHFNMVHAKEGIKCRFCDFKAASRQTVLGHESVHTGIKPFQCSQCNYSCMRRKLLDAHCDKEHDGRRNEVIYINDSKIEELKCVPESVLEKNAVDVLQS